MCAVNRETCFCKTNSFQMGKTWIYYYNPQSGKGNPWLSGKEKVPG